MGKIFNVFKVRNQLVTDFEKYVTGFIHINDERIRNKVHEEFQRGLLWPEPLIQLNPSYAQANYIDDLVEEGLLHPECSRIFRHGKTRDSLGKPLRLYKHQEEAIRAADSGSNYVLTTGTGSGKSLAFTIPIVNHVLRTGSGKGIQAIIVYPMNALANSQMEELSRYLKHGYPKNCEPVTFRRYTGQESMKDREEIQENPPDILLTNYVMLELILTRVREKGLVQAGKDLRFLVLDELHTYRGRQGADVAILVRRVREAFEAPNLQCIGTSATLASEGTFDEQRERVANAASLLFGDPVMPENVIGETLCRVTPERDLYDPRFIEELRCRISHPERDFLDSYDAFTNDPLSIWIESVLGVGQKERTGKLIRQTPISITGPKGAARKLAKLTGVDESLCVETIQNQLASSYDPLNAHPESKAAPFAFKVHQMISRGDTSYASLESPGERYVTLRGQRYVPREDRARVLYPLVFCRECGHEYYCVTQVIRPETGQLRYEPRQFGDIVDDANRSDGSFLPGYLYIDEDKPWPADTEGVVDRVPENWVEDSPTGQRIKRYYEDRGRVPRPVRVQPDGVAAKPEDDDAVTCAFIPSPFQFCPYCDIAYVSARGGEYGKLATLATEGRSSATTIISLSAVQSLRQCPELAESTRKLLSFTDNRQDASLQAGHFNDFVQVGLIRSALFRAMAQAEDSGLTHDILPIKALDAMNLPLEAYASVSESGLDYQARTRARKAMQSVLDYRLYCDLERGWRVTTPNLEQCDLLRIEYMALDELCRDERIWDGKHPALAAASPETREVVCSVLLDHMRRGLAINAECLNPDYGTIIRRRSEQDLIEPWAIEPTEHMREAAVLFPCSEPKTIRHRRDDLYSAGRGLYCRYLRRSTTFVDYPLSLSLEDAEIILSDLLSVLLYGGLLTEVPEHRRYVKDIPGYQVKASAMIWKAGNGTNPRPDPLRTWPDSERPQRVNPFFLEHYTGKAREFLGMEGREHTAQIATEHRLERERRFREGQLPVLYCSPTMELGIDIRDLAVVNMRNVPPSPANYAQRSGRAGRSGQPALVVTYCSTFSPHDQYFFRRPSLMVAGSVLPPRMELANEDLLRAHVHAILLFEAEISLGSSMVNVLDVSDENPTLTVNESIASALRDRSILKRAHGSARHVLESLEPDLQATDWYTDRWLEDVLNQAYISFDRVCGRWRDLYRSAKAQADRSYKIETDLSCTDFSKKNRAGRLLREAIQQLKLLANEGSYEDCDFYPYRYFAGEGFLPGYNFPRLPLSAYIPGRRGPRGKSEYISRPRFLAISEFGPRSFIYHEGARYQIRKVILPPQVVQGDEARLALETMKQCSACGCVHPFIDGDDINICSNCGHKLGSALTNLFRMANVATERAARINCDEEERQRMGYDIKAGFRFAMVGGKPSFRVAQVFHENNEIATITYAPSATISKISLGWLRRKEDEVLPGFVLDLETGRWARGSRLVERDDESVPDEDEMTNRKERVIPYVDDTKNCLIFKPAHRLDNSAMATVQAALKNAIQVKYQLEDSELAAEPLPDKDDRRLILLYEASEGGAGILRNLVDDPNALAETASCALRICHYDPDTLEDLGSAPEEEEGCEAACYDCLMSYSNQMDHAILDRKHDKVIELFKRLQSSQTKASPVGKPRGEHLETLLAKCESDLERKWLNYVADLDLRLPTEAQKYLDVANTRVDFYYEIDSAPAVAVYIDGPDHGMSDQMQVDRRQEKALTELGIMCLRFSYDDDWERIISEHPNIFGKIGHGAGRGDAT